jgi:REP element-mobilizing transposase RayT
VTRQAFQGVFSAESLIFDQLIEAKPQVNALYIGMRKQRELKQGVWYKIRTRINNREPLFRYAAALALFAEVFGETRLRFVFKIRALCLVDDWLSFYIKPANGLELPDIMKRLKQVFAQRYNRQTGRIGHIWGDRYWSLIVDDAEAEGSPAGAERGETDAGVRPRRGERAVRVRPQYGKRALQRLFFLIFPPPAASTPG